MMFKKYPIWVAIFLLVILFITLCFCNYWQNTVWTNLLDGLPTEIIGILVTLIFVQLLFDRYNANLQKEEEKKTILRFHKIVNLDIEKYKLFLSNMISNSHQEDISYDIKNSFDIKKLKYAHNICLLLNQSSQKTNIEIFLQAETNLRNSMISFLKNVDFRYYPEIQQCLLDYIKTSTEYDFSEAIKNDSIIIQNQKLAKSTEYADFISKLIEDDIENFIEKINKKEVCLSNILLKYVMLYEAINMEKEYIVKYLGYIDKI